MTKTLQILFLFSLLALAFSCSKEKKYQYEVNPVSVGDEGGEKNTRKSTTEFISIAYSDLFGTSIPQSKLVDLSVVYSSFGDLNVIEERIIANFLSDSSVVVPPVPAVNGDTTQFIINCYTKFFNRNPNAIEKHYWKELIRTNNAVTPFTIYYAMMTSDEYRFY
jgi:hypothetical protein